MTPIEFFGNKNTPVSQASAPGRLDVMGGIADYSGSLVLQMPLRERAYVMAALRDDDWVRVYSANLNAQFTLNLAPFRRLPTLYDVYQAAKEAIHLQKEGEWAAYIAGCLFTLCFDNRLPLRGIDFYVVSEVPLGKGVSSSAAVEVATLRALEQLFGITLNGTHLPYLAQRAENFIAGAPCGMMDQLASHFGQPGRLLPIICQPDKIFEPLREIPGIQFIGIDSGVRHSVGGASYSDVRTAAFMGYSILAHLEGENPKTLRGTHLGMGRQKLPWQGYLCNIPKIVFEEKHFQYLPETMRGADFIETYGQIIDTATSVVPEKNYAIRVCAAHPVFENARVRAFHQLFYNLADDPLLHDPDYRHEQLSRLGQWMLQSHESYSNCGLGNEATDLLVRLALERGPENGIFGAKITGGGSGGTVCLLVFGETGRNAALDLHFEYCALRGERVRLFEPQKAKD